MDQSDQNQKEANILKGISEAIATLKSTMTTLSKKGLSVTVTAEPKVVQIKLPDIYETPETLTSDLCGLINEAIRTNAKKIQESLNRLR